MPHLFMKSLFSSQKSDSCRSQFKRGNEKMKAQQKKLLEEIMQSDEETGLYDS